MRLKGIATEPIVTSQPGWIYLRTGLTSIMPPFVANAVEAQALLQSARANNVLMDKVDGGSLTSRYLAEALPATEWDRLCEAPNGDAALYRRTSAR
jgi:hypothetical protein